MEEATQGQRWEVGNVRSNIQLTLSVTSVPLEWRQSGSVLQLWPLQLYYSAF